MLCAGRHEVNFVKKSIFSIILSVILCIAALAYAGATELEDAEKELEEAEDAVEEAEDAVEEAEEKKEELEEAQEEAEEEQADLSAQLNELLAEMEELQEELDAKQDEIDVVEEELAAACVEENDQYESMKKRIKYLYENGSTGLLDVLLASEDMADFLNKAEYVSVISSYDREMLEAFQAVTEAVKEEEAALEEEYEELAVLQDELIADQEALEELKAASDAELAQIADELSENAELIADLEDAVEEAKKVQAEKEASVVEAGGSTVVVSGSGQFTHPCPGMKYQSGYFGEIRSFSSTPHKGNDYAASVGTPIYAAAAGTVTTAAYSSTAGNWVVINHGSGLVTKYMHMSKYCVSAGDTVVKGQLIGYVGNTGSSTGAHLHFQVEVNGTAVDPDPYLE